MFNMNFKNPAPEDGAIPISMLNMAFDNVRIVLVD